MLEAELIWLANVADPSQYAGLCGVAQEIQEGLIQIGLDEEGVSLNILQTAKVRVTSALCNGRALNGFSLSLPLIDEPLQSLFMFAVEIAELLGVESGFSQGVQDQVVASALKLA